MSGGQKVELTTDTSDPVNPSGPLTERVTIERFEKSLRVVINSVIFRSSGQGLTTVGTYTETTSRLAEPALLRVPVARARRRHGRTPPGTNNPKIIPSRSHQGRVLSSAGAFTDLAAQELMDDPVGPVIPPGGEVVVRRALRRQTVRETGPLAASPPLVGDRVHDLPHLMGALVAADRAVPVPPGGDHRLDQRPLLVR